VEPFKESMSNLTNYSMSESQAKRLDVPIKIVSDGSYSVCSIYTETITARLPRSSPVA
jgi:hypothetical protein